MYDQDDPVDALQTLQYWVKHIHIKDALRTTNPELLGEEVVWGQGHVNADAFLKMLGQTGFHGTLAIEREAGQDSLRDIKSAVNSLRKFR